MYFTFPADAGIQRLAPQAGILKSRLKILIKYKGNGCAAGENSEILLQNTNKIQRKLRRRRRKFGNPASKY